MMMMMIMKMEVDGDDDSRFLLLRYVEERPWWPIQSPKNGRKKKRKA